MEILKIVETISLLIAIICLALLFLQIRRIFIGDSDLQSLFLPIVMLLVTSMTYLALKKRVQEEQKSFSKSYYELKLNNGDIIRDSLQESRDYFYNDKGERYYKSNIVYSRKK